MAGTPGRDVPDELGVAAGGRCHARHTPAFMAAAPHSSGLGPPRDPPCSRWNSTARPGDPGTSATRSQSLHIKRIDALRKRRGRHARERIAAQDLEGSLVSLGAISVLDVDGRSDAEHRGMALQAMTWDTEAPAEQIDVEVTDGWVTVTGEFSYPFQTDAAYDDVADLFGAIGITNEIRVVN